MAKKEYYRETVKGIFGKKQVTRERRDRTSGRCSTTVDGPHGPRGGRDRPDHARRGRLPHRRQFAQRYLWADDASWLEGAFWYMADPHDRDGTDIRGQAQGPLLKFVHEDDRDFLLENRRPPEDLFARWPIKPRTPRGA